MFRLLVTVVNMVLHIIIDVRVTADYHGNHWTGLQSATGTKVQISRDSGGCGGQLYQTGTISCEGKKKTMLVSSDSTDPNFLL